MTTREAEIIELIRKEVKPALGCTEPIAVALAVAKAMEIIEERCGFDDPEWRMKEGYAIRIEVSGNILKNGMGVGIPGTGMVGLHIAAALGAVCGKSEYGLEVLNDLDEASIARAKELVEQKSVTVGLAETDHKLYVKASVETNGEHCASAVIEDDHDNIVETCFDQSVLHSAH
jgi:L-cysteine desulfidase